MKLSGAQVKRRQSTSIQSKCVSEALSMENCVSSPGDCALYLTAVTCTHCSRHPTRATTAHQNQVEYKNKGDGWPVGAVQHPTPAVHRNLACVTAASCDSVSASTRLLARHYVSLADLGRTIKYRI
jgi:hypothetical protein